MLVNGHGGNEFKPLIRDLQEHFGVLIVLVNFFQLIPEVLKATFDDPGDHAGEMETSMVLHLRPEWVCMEQAGPGATNPFAVAGLQRPGVWTPRPWSATPSRHRLRRPVPWRLPTRARCNALRPFAASVAEVLVAVSAANKGELPYE